MAKVGQIKSYKLSPRKKPKEPMFIVTEEHLQSFLRRAKAEELGFHRYQDAFSYLGTPVRAFSLGGIMQLMEALDLIMIERYGSGQENAEMVSFCEARLIDKELVPRSGESRFLEHQFEVSGFNGERKSMFAYIVSRMLIPALKRKVILSVPHGRMKDYAERGAFQVNIWSGPSGDRSDYSVPSSIFGIRTSCRDTPFKPVAPYISESEMDVGLLIMDDSYAVAELLPNALYIHHDLVHYGNTDEFKILVHLMKIVSKHLSTPGKLEKHAEKIRKDFEASQIALFEKIVRQGIPRRARRNEAAIKAAEEKSARLLQEHFAAEREAFGLRNASFSPDVAAKHFVDEFQKLASGSVALVQRVTIASDPRRSEPKLNVLTDVISVQHPGTRRWHRLGRFRIEFDLANGTVRFYNRDGPPRGTTHHAPHVDSDGIPCLGNISTDLASYIANYEIEAAVTLAIAYLQSVNIDDAYGRTIQYFPVMEEPARAA